MTNSKLAKISFLLSLGVLMYVLAVSSIIQNGERTFGKINNLWGPVLFLMLFVFSALITALLVLGYPIWLYFENKKRNAVKLLFYNTGWLFLFVITMFGIHAFIK